MRKRTRNKRQKGQAIVEYVIIVVVVALAALVILGAFSDRLRNMISGATNALGGDQELVEDGDSVEKLKDIGTDD